MKREDQEGLTLQVSSQDNTGNPEEDHINLGQNNAFTWGSKPVKCEFRHVTNV